MTTERIAGYVANEYNKKRNIRLVVLKRENLTFTPPAEPIGDSWYVLQILEKKIDLHVNQKYQLNINIGKLYALIIGKYTEALKTKLWSLKTSKGLDKRSNAA